MISESNPDGGSATEIKFPGGLQLPQAFKPISNYIQIDYQRQSMSGGLHIPGQAKPLEFVTAQVMEVGPDCKTVKKGDRIVVATKGIHGGDKGITIDGVPAFFTQESLVVAVVVPIQAQS